jgi:PKD repeat protein
MAYRFNGTSGQVEFAITPFVGASFGAVTFACLLKRNSVHDITQGVWTIRDSSLATRRIGYQLLNNDFPFFSVDATAGGTVDMPSTTPWYIAAGTWAGSGSVHYHTYNSVAGTWAHRTETAGTTTSTFGGTDRMLAGIAAATGNFLNADVVCMGVKKADSSDATIETLSVTNFQAWRDFGFHWLIGFNTALEAAGKLQDQGSIGTGHETARSGITTGVTDPPSWGWVPAAVTPVANFTGTPLTGTEPLAVTFTDSSTNTPTSWAWTFGDGGTSTAQNPSHSYTTAGTFTVALTATNSAGSNTLTRTGYVTVSDQPRPIRINTSQGWRDIGDDTAFVSGTGAPTIAAGASGAIYLDTGSGRMYGPKAGGAWPATALGGITGASGTTSARPASVPVGYGYWDTTLGKPVWWNGTVWKDATGTTV